MQTCYQSGIKWHTKLRFDRIIGTDFEKRDIRTDTQTDKRIYYIDVTKQIWSQYFHLLPSTHYVLIWDTKKSKAHWLVSVWKNVFMLEGVLLPSFPRVIQVCYYIIQVFMKINVTWPNQCVTEVFNGGKIKAIAKRKWSSLSCTKSLFRPEMIPFWSGLGRP